MRGHGASRARTKATRGGRTLAGTRVDARWDAALPGAMRAEGRAVHEEHVMSDLLFDLAEG